MDITDLYKTPEIAPLRAFAAFDAFDAAEDIVVETEIPDTVDLGTDIVLTLRVVNNGTEPQSGSVVIDVSAVGYNGEFIGAVGSLDATLEVDPGASRAVSVVVPVSTYLEWTAKTRTFETSVAVMFPGVGHVHLGVHRTMVVAPEPVLSVFEDGDALTLRVEWTNPLIVGLNDVKVIVATGDGLTYEGEHFVVHDVGLVAGGGMVMIDGPLEILTPGVHLITVNIQSAELDDVSASTEVEGVVDCNGNGIPDADEIANGSVADCNGNGVPDECDLDCNLNGIPDDCEIAANPSLDCNGNRILDSCDISAGTSADQNGNGVPDECDPDCNNNDIPDDIDIATGGSSDFNRNGIPDECDDDCNGNGIPDELDIALGTSLDEDLNGVPDECAEGQPNLPPVAVCRDITVTAGPDGTAQANVDNGSHDPAGGDILLEQQPPGPYPVGSTTVTLIVTNDQGMTAQCVATVTVVQAGSGSRLIGPGSPGYDPRRASLP